MGGFEVSEGGSGKGCDQNMLQKVLKGAVTIMPVE